MSAGWVDPSDHAEIDRRLKHGNRGLLEEVAQIIDGFPDGTDGAYSRHWITNAVDIGAAETVRWMIERGVELRFRDGEGYTPLHSCIDRKRGDRHEVLALLIEAGADVNAEGVHTWTPLHQAAIRDDQRAMKMLLDAGADPLRRTTIDNYATPAEEARRLGHAASADFIERYTADRYPFNDA